MPHPTPNTTTGLKVMMLVSSYPRGPTDSASIFLRNLAEGLRDRGLAIYVLAPADKRPGMTSENGVTVQRFRYFPRPWQKLAYGSGILPNLRRNPLLWLQVPFFLVCMTISLFRCLHKVRPDVLHAHWVIPQGLVAILGKLLYGIPTIITIHGGDAFALSNRMLHFVKKFSLQRADAWTSNTEETAGAFRADMAVPAPHIIPMGVNVAHFASGDRRRLRAEMHPNTQVIIFVGRLVEKKGISDLITAYSLLTAKLRKRTQLWIVGGGEQRAMLETLARELGVADRTKFWGRVSNEQLPDYYAAADLFVGPSVVAESGDTEGQGVVFLEAFAARTCVLATRTGGIAEVVAEGHTGLLVEPGQAQALAWAMTQLLNNRKLRTRLASNAYETVQQRYDWKGIARAFEELYRHILTTHSPRT